MPFRIKVSIVILCSLLGLLLIGPLIVPIAPLADTVPERELAQDDSRFVEVGGLELHYLSAGEAVAGQPVFVLLHGFGSSSESWRRVMPRLAEFGRVVAFDRPAFGLSERPMPGEWRGRNPYTPEAQLELTLALMDALGLEKAILVGNSSGGALAAQLALEHPERVAGLVLVDAAVYRGGGAPAWSRFLLNTPQLNRIGPLLMRQLSGESGQSFLEAAWSDPSRIDEATRAAYQRPLRAENWDRALWELSKASREPELAPYLAEIEQPALVMTGAEDRIVPPELSQRLADELPNAVLASFEDCGHLPQEECPEPFMLALENWLEQQGLLARPPL